MGSFGTLRSILQKGTNNVDQSLTFKLPDPLVGTEFRKDYPEGG